MPLFGSDLDEVTQKQLGRGERLVELLKQNQYSPMEVMDQVSVIFAVTKGLFDQVPVSEIKKAERELLEHLRNRFKSLMETLDEEKVLKKETEGQLREAIQNYVENRVSSN